MKRIIRRVYGGIDAFMQGFTDIHSHILPGVDDGAGHNESPENMQSRLFLFRQMKSHVHKLCPRRWLNLYELSLTQKGLFVCSIVINK